MALVVSLAGLMSCVALNADPWDLVPADSVAVVSLDWARIQGDSGLRRAVRSSGADQVLKVPGIGNSHIDTLIAFDDLSGSNGETAAVIARGRFDRSALAREASNRKLREVAYHGRTMHFDAASGKYASIMSRNIIVVGGRQAVEHVIDTADGRDGRFNQTPEASALIEQIGPARHPISLLVVLPQQYRDAGTAAISLSSTILATVGLSPLGTVLERIGLPGSLGIGLSSNERDYPVELVATMENERSAVLIAGSLTLLRGLASMLPAAVDSAQSAQLDGVRDLAVSREGPTISLKMTVAGQDLVR